MGSTGRRIHGVGTLLAVGHAFVERLRVFSAHRLSHRMISCCRRLTDRDRSPLSYELLPPGRVRFGLEHDAPSVIRPQHIAARGEDGAGPDHLATMLKGANTPF